MESLPVNQSYESFVLYNVLYYSGIMNNNHGHAENEARAKTSNMHAKRSNQQDLIYVRASTVLGQFPFGLSFQDLPLVMKPLESSRLAHSVQLPSYTCLPSSG